MPAPIVGGLITLLENNLDAFVWDGETPRQDTSGNPINPESTAGPPSNWPAIQLYMDEGGFTRSLNCGTDPYMDVGEIVVYVSSTLRSLTEQTMGDVEALMVASSNWGPGNVSSIPLGGPPQNPYYVISIRFTRWASTQELNDRLAGSQYQYKGGMHFEVSIHGAISTQ